MNPYFQLSKDEKLALTSTELTDAIKLEAINRKIKPPVPLSDALNRSGWVGYQKPAESILVYELSMNNYSHSGIGYLDKALAERALEGLVKIEHGYKSTPRIEVAAPCIQVVHVGVSASTDKSLKFQEYTRDDTEFDKLRDECVADLSTLRQDAYNTRVRAERRVEYLRLAGGNEDIAKAFWAKAEGTEWPTIITA